MYTLIQVIKYLSMEELAVLQIKLGHKQNVQNDPLGRHWVGLNQT